MSFGRQLSGFALAALAVAMAATVHAQNSLPPPELDKLLDDAGRVWTLTADDFAELQSSNGFRWTSAAAKDVARSTDPELTFTGLRVWETLARFDGGTLKELTLSLYNRGDAGTMHEDEFLQLLSSIDKSVTAWSGMRGIAFKGEQRTTSITVVRKAWVKGPHRVDMVWSFTEKSLEQGVPANRPEYVRLEITRFDPANDPRHLIATSLDSRMHILTAPDLRARVLHAPDGDVLIRGVPMVDQGPKGYCAAAVAERLLRYFGKEVDQHEIAQMANTTAGGGTSPQAMITALRRISDELKLDVTVQQDFDVREFERLIKDYNRSAKNSHASTIQLSLSGSIDLAQIYAEMDTDLLREARRQQDADMTTFKNTVVKYVQNGVPLAWSVMYGKVSETPPVHGVGGHMRIIIGYNNRNGEILYSDSWGAGHELKRLPLIDAWTMTLGLYTVQPRDIHF
jgi:hypothetical protein